MTKFKLRVIEDAQHHMVSIEGPQVIWTFELLKDLSYSKIQTLPASLFLAATKIRMIRYLNGPTYLVLGIITGFVLKCTV